MPLRTPFGGEAPTTGAHHCSQGEHRVREVAAGVGGPLKHSLTAVASNTLPPSLRYSMEMLQSTLARSIGIDGVGLHSGRRVSVELRPSDPNLGIRIVRDDVTGAVPVRIGTDVVVDDELATTVGAHGWTVRTVEHLLAACMGAGVSNLEIGVSGPEVPALDGSAGPWFDLLTQAGLVAQEADHLPLELTSAVRVDQGDRWIEAFPHDHLEITATVDYPLLGAQHFSVSLNQGQFDQLAWARTFGFAHEVDAMRARGFIAGASLENAVVYDTDGVLNPGGLRHPDEAVRHKILDIVGDLALLGQPLHARIVAHHPGHALTHALVKELAQQQITAVQRSSLGSICSHLR